MPTTTSVVLTDVRTTEGALAYTYDGSWVTSVAWTDKTTGAKPEILRSIEYNARGQVTADRSGETILRRTFAAVREGIAMTTTETGDKESKHLMRYDQRMRPVEATEADGTHTTWIYRGDGGVVCAITAPDQRKTTISASGDGRKQRVEADGIPSIEKQYDDGGRLVRMAIDDHVALTQRWRPDGQLDRAETDANGVVFTYNDNGVLSSVLVCPPNAGDRLQQWQETQLDRRGNPVTIKDATGLDVQLAYDTSGALAGAVQKTSDGNLGFNIERDSTGLVRAVKSSWGDTFYTYASNGDLQRMEMQRGKATSSVELANGLARRAVGFDGGTTVFNYHTDGELAGAVRNVTCANGLELASEYDAENRLAAVGVGPSRRVRLMYDQQGYVVEYVWERMNAD